MAKVMSNFSPLFKLRAGVDDYHELVKQMSHESWFRQTDFERKAEDTIVRMNAMSAKKNVWALSLRTKPHHCPWMHLSTKIYRSAKYTFEHALAVINKIHHYLRSIIDFREKEKGAMLQFIQDKNTMS